MLPGEIVLQVMNAVKSSMPTHTTRFISNITAPYFRNWQGVFSFSDNTIPDDIFAFAKQANEILKQDTMKLNKRQLYGGRSNAVWLLGLIAPSGPCRMLLH